MYIMEKFLEKYKLNMTEDKIDNLNFPLFNEVITSIL